MRKVTLVSMLVSLVGSVAEAQSDSATGGAFGALSGTLSASQLFASPVQPALALSSAAVGAGDEKDNGPDYLSLKAGPLWFTHDLDSLDTGVSTEIAFGYRFIRILSVELQSGYFGAEDPDGSTKTDVWGIPVAVNVKLSLPLLLFQPYVGVGVGGYYVHAEVETAVNTTRDDDFVFGGNAFVGLGLRLGPISAGVEVKYVVTEQAEFQGAMNDLNHVAALLSVGLRF